MWNLLYLEMCRVGEVTIIDALSAAAARTCSTTTSASAVSQANHQNTSKESMSQQDVLRKIHVVYQRVFRDS